MVERESETWPQTEWEEQSRYNAGRETRGFDVDMGIMSCHAQKEWHWDSARSWWGSGGWLKWWERGCQLSLTRGWFASRRPDWLAAWLGTLLNLSDLSPRQHWGERTVLKGWWVINDSEGVASGLTVTDSQLGLCNFWVCVFESVCLLGVYRKGERTSEELVPKCFVKNRSVCVRLATAMKVKQIMTQTMG